MSLSKKIFLTSSVLLAVVLIFWGIYNLSFNNKNNGETASKDLNTTAPDTKTSPADAQIQQISEEAVLAPFIDTKNFTIKYYAKETGHIYQIDFDGKHKKTISDIDLPGLVDSAWSPDGTKVISKFLRGSVIQSSYYDFIAKKNTPLNENMSHIVWQSDNKIFYTYHDPKTQQYSLNISNPDGSNWAKITNLNHGNISVAQIPRTGLVSFWNTSNAFFETDFESTLVIGGDNKLIFKEKFGADYLWNNNGTYALVSHADQKSGSKTQLAIINNKGGEYKNLSIETFVSKCAWSRDNKTIYCALPNSLPANIILPNDYQDKKFSTQDSFWKFNTLTGEKLKFLGIDKMPGDIDAENLFFNADESMLFFVNRIDNKLYRIDL